MVNSGEGFLSVNKYTKLTIKFTSNAFQTKMCFSKRVIFRKPHGNSSESILQSL